MSYHQTIQGIQVGHLDYNIGDKVMNDAGEIKGTCTGFTHDDTCILIDGKCWGGKYYFHKADTIDIEVKIIK